MGIVTIQEETTKYPISLIGKEAGVCWGANTKDEAKNYRRGIDCIKAQHGRTWEFPQVYLTIDGYSARVIRELYTHIGGGPTRLQSSTRYVDYKNFEFVIPPSIEKDTRYLTVYKETMANISASLTQLEKLGAPREDIAMLLPLGMTTRIVLRTNMRNLVDMSHQRLCNRAYWEFRTLMNDIAKSLYYYSPEWEYVVDQLFVPKCDITGYCCEKKSCGRRPKKSED